MVVKKVRNLTTSEIRSCHAMSFRNDGDISGWLYNSKHYHGGNDDVVLYREDGKVVGWAMRRENGDVGYWVRRSHRRQGIGTKLVKRTQKLGKINTHPHDLSSAKLFAKTNTFPDRVAKRTWTSYIKRIEIENNEG